MKVLAIALALAFAMASPALAGPAVDWLEDMEGETQVLALDAPYLVKLGNEWALGAEVSKDLHNTNSDSGWSFITRVTYLGNWKSFFGSAT